MNKNYVYPYSRAEAKRNNELEQYEISFKENLCCADCIEKTINHNFDGYRLNKDTAKQVITEFGYDRVNFVLAHTVKELKHDGRFSRDNKEWAKAIYISENMLNGRNANSEFRVDSHPSVLDGFVNQARKEYQKLELWERTHCNDKTYLDFEGRVMVIHTTCLKEKYKNPRDQLILCEGGFGCSPTANGRKVFGRFLSDGERCQYDRSDFIGELKAEYLPNWAREQVKEMRQQSASTMGGIEMK